MTAALLLAATLGADPSPADAYLVEVRRGADVLRFGFVVKTPAGPLAKLERELLAEWKPSADGSDPLDRLVPDGRLLRVVYAPPSPQIDLLTRALFQALDRNGDRTLDDGELKDAAKTLLAKFDTDGDDCLTPLEIVPDLLTTTTPAGAVPAVTVRRPGPADPLGTGDTPTAIRTDRLGRVAQSRGYGLTIDLAVGAGSVPVTPNGLLRPGREKERERFDRVARAVVTLTVRPQRRGWFQRLDTDDDGRLSVRELRAVAEVLPDDDALHRHPVTLPDLTGGTAISLDLAPGLDARPPVRLTPVARPPRGPTWFRASDRNGDGDVSRKEFIGPDEVFKQYDTDNDGLISVAEAEAGDSKRKEKR